jgi:hypothetical protein
VLAEPDVEYRTTHCVGRRFCIADGIGVVFTEDDERGVVVVTVIWPGVGGRDDDNG